MPFVSSGPLLMAAQAGGYAVGAFNVENMEMAQAVVAAAETVNAPVILQTTAGTLKYAPPKVFAGMISRLGRDAKVPVALHLDHCGTAALCAECLREGYTSVMIDGSKLSYADNVALTRSVVAIAGDAPVEAELGTIGGKEDGLAAAIQYTDPDTAAAFVQASGATSLAPAIGTAHGVYKTEPKLDIARLAQIRARTEVPLVLHGASGVSEADVRACIAQGISKINYATELRIAFSKAVKLYIAEHPDVIDPKEYLAQAREAVGAKVIEIMTLCGCAGRG